jgi:hypothetical protein
MLRRDGVNGYTVEELDSIAPSIRNARDVLADMLKLQHDHDEFTATRLRTIGRLEEAATRCNQTMRPVVMFHSLARQIAHESEISQLKIDATTALREIAAIKQQAIEAARDTAVAAEAAHFKGEADAQNKYAKAWLAAATVLAVGAVCYLFAYVKPDLAAMPAETPIRKLVAFGAVRVVVLSVWWFAIVFAIRNYTASRHNHVINRHRQNALNTFQAFVNAAAADDQTKNAVLLQATTCIFAPQSTGYLKGEAEPQQPNQLIEIVKTIPVPKP